MLARYDSIAIAPRRYETLNQLIAREGSTNMAYVQQEGKWSHYVPVAWLTWLQTNGFKAEAEALWTIRRTTGKVKSTIPHLPAVIWYLNLPIRCYEGEDGREYVQNDSSYRQLLDSIISV